MKSIGTANLRIADIYHGNGNVDFPTLKKQGYDGVIIKATEGESFTDPMLTKNAAAAKSAGLNVGYYHYFSLTADIAAAGRQAKHFNAATKNLPADYKPAVDVEQRSTETVPEAAAFSAAVRACTEAVKMQAGGVMLYANPDMIRTHFTAALGAYDLWIAHYGVAEPADVPFFSAWTGWQKSDEGGLDQDVFTQGVYLPGKVQAGGPSALWNREVYPIAGYSRRINAKASARFDVCGRDGKPFGGHCVSAGDSFSVLAADYDRQLLEIEYPAGAQTAHGFIRNRPGDIRYLYAGKWQNGSTPERVFDGEKKEIGTIFAGESATPLYRDGTGLAVIYDTAKGRLTKSGYVAYTGGFHLF